jgi:DNA helicase-4
MNDRIAEFTSRFIQRNPKQLQKKVNSVIECNHDPVKIAYRDPYSESNEIEELLEKLDRRAIANSTTWKVFILGRYRFNRPDDLQRHKDRFKNLQVEFLTAHGSKGLEADFVLIDDLVAGEYGFPCGIADDPLLGLILSEPEPMKHAEERRLFYVAATRARHKVFLFTDARRKSPFVSELERDLVRRISCPSCEGGLLFLSRIRQKPFWTCNNYPNCDYCLIASEVADVEAFKWQGLEGRGHICPSCRRSHLVIKHNRDSGEAFWGCNDFRRTGCQFTQPLRRRKKIQVA